MKIYDIISSVVAVIGVCVMTSCGDKSEDLTPGDPEINYFEVDPTDKSERANMRRDFFDNTGIYLLFNDLLAIYVDNYGIEREERVDFNWNVSGSSSYRWTFDELDDVEASASLNLLSKYFIPYINVEGGTFKPYSIMLVKNLLSNANSSSMRSTAFLSCWRCFGINANEWIGIDEEEARNVGKSFLKSLVQTKLNAYSPEINDFAAICQPYYEDYYVANHIPDWIYEQNEELIYELGFLTYYPDSWGEPEYDAFPYQSTDFRLFLDAVLLQDESDFLEKWGDYPVIIQKYNLMKQCIENLGVDLNAVK